MSAAEIVSSDSVIGAELDLQFKEILALSDRLRAATGEDYSSLLEQVDQPLNKAIGSISMIGQVKAGKTSLINSLIERTGFLPSDVNPWTAVITKLFFGKPGGPDDGALFSFFDDKEWDKFANRGGRLGEIAQAIPGSETKLEEIKVEIERMRTRARLQLGNSFETLLGGNHRFKKATQEVLGRYICVGDDPENTTTSHVQGRFADITKEAAIFFPKEKFGFPTALVDTPGLNDPLLIREEITLQSLEHSDVFVLVLSAHQAFSSSDLYLLRVLNALRLDRLVVFVNRVDELSNPARDIPKIRGHIESMLNQECPGADIPVVFGSAYLAAHAIDQVQDVNFKTLDAIYDLNNQTETSGSRKFSDDDREKLWVASGLPALEQHMSNFLTTGPGLVWKQSAQVNLGNVNNVILRDSEARLNNLKLQQAEMSGGGNINKVVSTEIDIENLEAELEKVFAKVSHTLEQSASAAWPRIQQGLRAVTEEFTEQQDELFGEYLKDQKSAKKRLPWTCDTTGLRRSMNWYFREEFPKVQHSLMRKLENVVAEVSESLTAAGLENAGEIRINTAEFVGHAPVTSALSKVVPFDMEPSWWTGWFSKFTNDTKAREELMRMIRKQFLPIEVELLDRARDTLIGSSAEALEEFKKMQLNLVSTLRKQEEDKNSTTPVSAEELNANIHALEKRITVCIEVSEILETSAAA